MKSFLQLTRATLFLMILALPTLAVAADGATLFATYCAGCHNKASLSGRTAAQIQTAMTSFANHSGFRSSLLAADYQSLATYLASGATTLTITTTSLAAGSIGAAYSQTLAATGGTTPYTWAVASGTLPAGLTLSGAGVISGTPTASATVSVTFRATDSATTKATATKALSITISATSSDGAALFSSTCARCHTAAKLSGRTVSQIQSAMTGVASHSGISLSTAQIQSIATYLGGSTQTPTKLTITTTSLPVAVRNSAYSQTLIAGGGTPPYIWSYNGRLPPGLRLYASGVLSGTPTTLSSWSFTVRVSDAKYAGATKSLTVTVAATAPLTITSATLAAAVDIPYTQALSASGGKDQYTWKITGILPPGLGVTSAGTFFGTPTSGGTYTFTATVTDAAKATTTAPISLSVTSSPVLFPTDKPARYGGCANCHTSTPYTTPSIGKWTPGRDDDD